MEAAKKLQELKKNVPHQGLMKSMTELVSIVDEVVNGAPAETKPEGGDKPAPETAELN